MGMISGTASAKTFHEYSSAHYMLKLIKHVEYNQFFS
tara:strand:+ start:524 stop:634 length:111 start_codon:yes stop_codon:yes gene_type:complete